MHAFILGVQAGDGATACVFLAESEKKEFLLGATEVTDVDASSRESAVESSRRRWEQRRQGHRDFAERFDQRRLRL